MILTWEFFLVQQSFHSTKEQTERRNYFTGTSYYQVYKVAKSKRLRMFEYGYLYFRILFYFQIHSVDNTFIVLVYYADRNCCL